MVCSTTHAPVWILWQREWSKNEIKYPSESCMASFYNLQKLAASSSFCCWLAEEGDDPTRTTGEMKWGKGWDEDDMVPLVAREEAANSGNEGYEGKESNRSAVEAGRRTVGALLGIGRPGGVPFTYPPEPDPWDEWDSWKGGSLYGRWSDNRDRWGHRPGVTVGLKPRAMARTELGEGAAV